MLDIAMTLGGLVIPPLFNFIKGLFGKNDTPEATMSALATTKPEALEGYTQGMATLMDAQTKFFNRDVVGVIPGWVGSLRAAIRPIAVCVSIGILVVMAVGNLFYTAELVKASQVAIVADTLTGIRLSCEGIIASWFGSRVSLHG